MLARVLRLSSDGRVRLSRSFVCRSVTHPPTHSLHSLRSADFVTNGFRAEDR